jgi:hypothetical protein
MKITQTNNPSKSNIASQITRQNYSAILTIQIDALKDIQSISKEAQKFINKDLCKHSIIILKHQ